MSVRQLVGNGRPFHDRVRKRIRYKILAANGTFKRTSSGLLRGQNRRRLVPQQTCVLTVTRFRGVAFRFFDDLHGRHRKALLHKVRRYSLVIMTIVRVNMRSCLHVVALHNSRDNFDRLEFGNIVKVRGARVVAINDIRANVAYDKSPLVNAVRSSGSAVSIYPFVTFLQTSVEQTVVGRGGLGVLVHLVRSTTRAAVGPSFGFVCQGRGASR